MGQFAFILHPMEVSDVFRRYPALKILPERLIEGIMRYAPPFTVSRITGIKSQYGETEGHFVVCPLSSRLMMELPEEQVVSRIVAAGRMAERLGARIVGLGALTAVVGDAGRRVAEQLDIPVTTGNSYTVATAIEGTRRAVEYMGYDLQEVNLAVVGATGSIGQVCATIMAREVRQLTLVARDRLRLEALRDRILADSGVSSRISTEVSSALTDCEAVITVSSAVDAIVEPEYLRSGAVVCDVARPRDVSKRVAEARDDILVIEGGVVSVPGEPDFGFNFGVPADSCMACMAETMVLALEERYESYTLGRDLTIRQVEEIDRLASKHGFALSGFRAFEREVSQDELEAVRRRAHQQRGKRCPSCGDS